MSYRQLMDDPKDSTSFDEDTSEFMAWWAKLEESGVIAKATVALAPEDVAELAVQTWEHAQEMTALAHAAANPYGHA